MAKKWVITVRNILDDEPERVVAEYDNARDAYEDAGDMNDRDMARIYKVRAKEE